MERWSGVWSVEGGAGRVQVGAVRVDGGRVGMCGGRGGGGCGVVSKCIFII